MKLPARWEVARLGDYIFKPEYGYTASATDDSTGTKFLRITDIQDERVDWHSVPYCKCNDETKRKYSLEPGDIVIARIGATTGKAFLLDDCPESIFASYLIRVKAKPPVLSQFLSIYFRSEDYWRQIRQNKGGRLKGGVNIPILQNLRIPLPPLPEQRAIASVLGAIQEAKFARQKEIALERERKAALMDYLFSHGTRGEPRKQTEIGEIPESWELVRLGDYCHKPDYGYTESANDSQVGPKFLRITDIQNDEVNWGKVPYCICSAEDREKYSLKTGDIVIARIGATTGKAYMVEDCPDAVFASYLIRVRTKENLLPDFLAQYFRTNGYWKQINQSKGGRLKGGVNIPILSRLVLPLPRLSEQQEIAKIFQACDTKIAALEREIGRLDELFHAMLEELMTGQRSAVPLIDVELPN
ncbi:MAG: restriction endonuclease subunit S [Candidatus Poribacteria bacterium]|nr:restriction endonuclease subunit S [Candidatus Poribacteria bacterium]